MSSFLGLTDTLNKCKELTIVYCYPITILDINETEIEGLGYEVDKQDNLYGNERGGGDNIKALLTVKLTVLLLLNKFYQHTF